MNNQNKIPSEAELEEFKKNWMERIETIAKDKTAWNDFKETYSNNRKTKVYENSKIQSMGQKQKHYTLTEFKNIQNLKKKNEKYQS